MSNAEYAGQSTTRMKELTLQMKVDVLLCRVVDAACS